MKYIIHIVTIAVLVCQVLAQLCVGSGPTVVNSPLNGPYVGPQVVASPVVATTIVDNSVANALANVLQLLIVSDLIQSKLPPLLASNSLSSCYAPILERTPLCSPIIDVVTPCATPIDILPPCVPIIETSAPIFYGGVTETITPNIYGGYTETISSNPFITETICPNYCGGWTEAIASLPCAETIYQNYCGGWTEAIGSTPCAEPIYQNYCGGWAEAIAPTQCGITEILSPNIAYGQNVATVIPNVCGCLTDVISSNPYVQVPANNIYDVVPSNFYGSEIVASPFFAPNYCGGIAEVMTSSFNPGCFGVAEVISNPYANFYGGLPEVILPQFNSPCINGLTEVLTPNYYGGATEVILPYNPGCVNGIAEIISPTNQFNPGCLNIADILAPNPYSSCFGGIKEFVAPTGPFSPVGAEVVFPQAIPAQLTCNFGYMPTTVPCVSVNVETLPFEPCGCGCNSFPKGFYF